MMSPRIIELRATILNRHFVQALFHVSGRISINIGVSTNKTATWGLGGVALGISLLSFMLCFRLQ